MGMIQNILKKMSEKKAKIKALEEDRRVEQAVDEKMKSSNQRELEKFLKRQQEDKIKVELEKFRIKQRNETWRGNNILSQKNIFRGHTSVLTDNKKLFKGTKQNQKGGMFFK